MKFEDRLKRVMFEYKSISHEPRYSTVTVTLSEEWNPYL